jgi:hypothetical protein
MSESAEQRLLPSIFYLWWYASLAYSVVYIVAVGIWAIQTWTWEDLKIKMCVAWLTVYYIFAMVTLIYPAEATKWLTKKTAFGFRGYITATPVTQ